MTISVMSIGPTQGCDAVNHETPATATLLFFSAPDCGVCSVLWPKIHDLIVNDFPKIAYRYVQTDQESELAAQHSVFAVPTILVFFDQRETLRYVRNLGIGQLKQDLQRPYQLYFSTSN